MSIISLRYFAHNLSRRIQSSKSQALFSSCTPRYTNQTRWHSSHPFNTPIRFNSFPNRFHSNFRNPSLSNSLPNLNRTLSQSTGPSPWRPSPRRTPTHVITRNGYSHFNRGRNTHATPILRNILFISGAGIVIYVYSNIDYAPFTNRRRILGISNKYEIRMGKHAYEQVLAQYDGRILPSNHPQAIRVKRMINRIADTATHLDSSVGKGFEWTVNVVQDPTPNALCTPGGRILVTTSMIQLMHTDDELAMILAHEIAHALNRHGAESMHLHQLLVPFFVLMELILGIPYLPAILMKLILSLPYSRRLELEADTVGLLLCAEACYNPEIAPKVFKKLATIQKEAPTGTIRSGLSTFISTHPQSTERAKRLQQQLPKRIERYNDKCSVADQFIRHYHTNRNNSQFSQYY